MKFIDLVRARADERAMRGLSRRMLILHVRRALEAFGDERAVEIVRELEMRLPEHGVDAAYNYNDGNARILNARDVWVGQDSSVTHLHALDDSHLQNIINLLRSGRRKNGEPVALTDNQRDHLPAMIREAVWRGLDFEEMKQCATCHVWINRNDPAWKQGCDCKGREPR